MSIKEGEDKLRTVLAKIAPTLELDTLLCYKYGNRQNADAYQRDEIFVNLKGKEREAMRSGVPFVVIYFIHMDIFAAWPSKVGLGSGKYNIHKGDLVEFENHPESEYKEVLIEKGKEKAYIVRNETGIEKFLRNALSLWRKED